MMMMIVMPKITDADDLADDANDVNDADNDDDDVNDAYVLVLRWRNPTSQ